MGLSAHQSARMKNDEWLTPPEILRALGTFDLDPCAPIIRPWETATSHYTVADDGLSKPWHGRVWCNPPFGREAIKWLRRMRDHGNGVALIPARTETAMFYECVWGAADGVLFLKGRPHFHYVDGRRAAFNSGAPIALAAYGSANLDTLRHSGLGFVVVGSMERPKDCAAPQIVTPMGLNQEDRNAHECHGDMARQAQMQDVRTCYANVAGLAERR